MQPISLLTTKFHIPRIRPELVPRPRLIRRLNAGLGQGGSFARKLTLVCAPAGFGKTTLVSEWCQAMDGATSYSRVAWLSLDEGDNDPARFLTYVITALNQIAGTDATFGEGALRLLQAPQPPPTETILTSLINEIATIAGGIVLVLDDTHLIEAQPVTDALAFLLEHLPPQMHLVITTRVDPELPVARLRARGRLTELRAADLRFTPSEAATFLNQAMGLSLSAEELAALATRTEGWIAGLQLAAISLQGRADTSRLIQSFAGTHRFVLDYLVEEVLHQQSESVQTFLLTTSLLDRLCGPLCDAVLLADAGSGQKALRYLDDANLLLVPLDDSRQWYRYHHLFADVLQARLREQQPDQVAALHRRASAWYERNDLPSEAIRHAMATEEFERAAGLAELAWPAMSGGGESTTWLSWVMALPDEVVRARPVLCVAYAFALLSSGRLEAAEVRLLDAERWLHPAGELRDRPQAGSTKMVVVDEAQFQSLPASLATARAYHAQAIGDLAGTVMYTRRILDLLPEGDHPWRGAALSLLGLAHYASGDPESAHRAMSDGVAGMDPLEAMTATFVLADMKMVQGRLHEAARAYKQALQLVSEHGEPMPLGTEDLYTGVSKLHRERGDLEVAAQDLLTAKRLGEQIELPDWQHRWCIAQARLNETQGDLAGALDLLDEAERLYVRTPVPDPRPIGALRARVWIAQDRLAEARGWVRGRGLSVDDDLSYLREFEHLTLGRLLIAQTRRDRAAGSLQGAMGLLARLLQAAEDGRRMGSELEILVLQALAHEVQGNNSPALASLERALTLAEPEGYLRLFVDEGPPMARLLYQALSHGIAPDYVRRLLTAFPVLEPVQPEPPRSRTAGSEWVEPLSERETEVLQLIAEGLTNHELATRLYLSVNTIKVHTRNIYGKLGVHSRTSAVAKARALGLLPSA